METETITLHVSDFSSKKDYYNTKQEFLMLGFIVKESSKKHFTLCKDYPVENNMVIESTYTVNNNKKEKNKHASILRRSDTPEYLKFKNKKYFV